MTPGTAQSKGSATRRRRAAICVAAAVLPIIALLAGLELVLRLVGYGYPPGFLLSVEEGSLGVIVDNPRFMWRFMPPPLARSPSPIQVAAAKPEGQFRVVVFGESAAMGDLEAAHRFLRGAERGPTVPEAAPTLDSP